MNYGDATKEHMVWIVRKLLVRRPDATAVEICKYLERNGYPNVHPNFANELKRKAMAARIKSASLQTKKLAFGEYDDNLREALSGAWSVASDSTVNPGVRLMAYSLIAKIGKQRNDAFLESGLSDKKEVGDAANPRALALLPPDLREQRDRWIEKQGMLVEPQLDVPADVIAAEVEAEVPEDQRDEEEEKRKAEEAQQKEKEQQEREEEARRQAEQENARYEAAVRELGPDVIEKAKTWIWPNAALAFPLDIRIKKVRETWGTGRPAESWDIHWQLHFGSTVPPF